jgi:hypothetical protein
VLRLAKEGGWTYGCRLDPNARSLYRHVLYVDTPGGQASFHLRNAEGFPAYRKDWSGHTDTYDILCSLADRQTGSALPVAC